MKNKVILAMVLVACLCLSACGNPDKGTTSDSGATDTVEANESANMERVEAMPTPELEPEPYKTITVSDWGVYNIRYLNKKYCIAQKEEGGKWAIIKSSDGEQSSNKWIREDKEYRYEFDSIVVNLQDGHFTGDILLEDGQTISALFSTSDERIELVRSFAGPSAHVYDYRDGLIFFTSPSNEGDIYAACTYDGEKYVCTKSIDNDVFASSYGILVFDDNVSFNGIGSAGVRFKTSDVVDLLNESTQSTFTMRGRDGYITNTWQDKAARIWGVVPSKEGWVLASLWEREQNDAGQYTITDTLYAEGFYNVFTDDFVEAPKDVPLNCRFFTEDNGASMCVATDSKVAYVYEEVDNPDSEEETSDNSEEEAKISAYRIFDLKTADWANEDEYLYIDSFGYHKNVLVESLEGKWGFIDNDTMEHVGEWYDDATAFCNGFALVTVDGNAYLVNEELEKVSESIEAKGGFSVTDYFVFSDLDGESRFFVKLTDDKYHLLTVE